MNGLCEVCNGPEFGNNLGLCASCWNAFEGSREHRRFVEPHIDWKCNSCHLADYVRRVRAEKANGAK